MFHCVFFGCVQESVKQHGDQTQKDDGHHDPVHLKDLASVNDQISKPRFCGQKFSDDNAYQRQSDADFHQADKERDTAWDYRKAETVGSRASQCPDQDQTFRINFHKSVIQVQDASENGDGMAVIMIVFMLFPSQTIRIGARADFGRLFNTTR